MLLNLFFQNYVSGRRKLNMNDSTREYYAHDMVKSGRRFLVSKMCASQFKNDTDLYNKCYRYKNRFSNLFVKVH